MPPFGSCGPLCYAQTSKAGLITSSYLGKDGKPSELCIYMFQPSLGYPCPSLCQRSQHSYC